MSTKLVKLGHKQRVEHDDSHEAMSGRQTDDYQHVSTARGDDGGKHEEASFLNDDIASGCNKNVEAQMFSPRPSHHAKWKISVFILLILVTICGLCIIPFSFTPSGSHLTFPVDDHGHEHVDSPGEDSHPSPIDEDAHEHEDEDEHEHENEGEAEDHVDNGDDILHFKEEIPGSPTVRSSSEYVLDMSWDLNASPITREYNWTIMDGDLNPDGVYRPMILINNQYPGPLIECNDGDSIVVHVDNRAVNATSFHFHGLFQNGTNLMDGTVGVTQCPIAPNTTFTYRFDVKGQSGTYWYHAHHSAQASDGLLGPFIVHTRDERSVLQELDYASDRIIMLQDHYHNLTSELLLSYLASDMENEEPVPDNALINGRGKRSCDDFPGWRCDEGNVSTSILDLEANQRHRLRVLNVGAFAEFQVQFDEHPFYVTEVDGTDVHPEPFHRLNILPAQRYSIVLETNVTTAASYWMRARMVTHCFTAENRRLEPEIKAIIRYAGDDHPSIDEADPTSKDWEETIEIICRDLNTTLLHPVVPETPPPATAVLPIRASFQIGDWRLARGFFNESTWHGNSTSPSLHRFLSSSADMQSMPDDSLLAPNTDIFDAGKELILQTQDIQTVDLVINNFDDGVHPFHLHGHKFYVLTQQHDEYPPDPEDVPAYIESHQLLQNPLRRDTVAVEGFGWAILRIVLDNPGMWTFHCHNTWHSESGMVMQFLVRSRVVSGWKVGEEESAMCQLEGVERGVRPDDSIWFGNFGS